MYTSGFAGGVRTTYTLEGAKQKCLELGVRICKAITCVRGVRASSSRIYSSLMLLQSCRTSLSLSLLEQELTLSLVYIFIISRIFAHQHSNTNARTQVHSTTCTIRRGDKLKKSTQDEVTYVLGSSRRDEISEALPKRPATVSVASNVDADDLVCRNMRNPPPWSRVKAFGSSEDSTAITKWENVEIVHGLAIDSIAASTDLKYFLYVPEGFTTPPISTLRRLQAVLEMNPDVDVVGANVLRDDRIVPHCHHLELCHWTLMLHFEYVDLCLRVSIELPSICDVA